MSKFGKGNGDGTFRDDAGYGTEGTWGARIVRARAAKAGAKEATGEVCYHEVREQWYHWAY